MFHLKLKIVAFIFVCEVMLWIEWLCSHVGRLVAAGIDSLREQKNVTFHSCELLSNHIPSKEEIYCLLLGGIICKYFPFTMFRLKLDAIIFVCEVMLLIEALRSHVAMLVAAEMDSLRKQRSVKIDSHELVSNLIPSKKEGMYCPLLEGFTDRKSAENEKQRSETTGNTKLSDDTSCREVQTDSESESQLYEEGARRTVDEAVIFDWRSHEVRLAMSWLSSRVFWAQGNVIPMSSHHPTVILLHCRERNGSSPPMYFKQRRGNWLPDMTHFGKIGKWK